MVVCAVSGCGATNSGKRADRSLNFYKFPKDESIAWAWDQCCGRKEPINLKTAKICSKHFQPTDYERNLKNELLGIVSRTCPPLKPGTVPTLCLPIRATKKSKSKSARALKMEKKARAEFVEEILR